VSARLPGGGIRGLVPDDADPYGETKPDAVRDWARSALEFTYEVRDNEGEPVPVRSTVESWHVTLHKATDQRSVTVSGVFRLPPDGYYKQGKEIGNWSFHVTTSPHNPGGTAEIDGVGVRWEHRGQGIARRWLGQLEQALRAQGTQQIRLYDLSHAGRGTSYWEQFGFRRDGDTHVKAL
jgi:GNAT superfamily N-acetyltransferase